MTNGPWTYITLRTGKHKCFSCLAQKMQSGHAVMLAAMYREEDGYVHYYCDRHGALLQENEQS